MPISTTTEIVQHETGLKIAKNDPTTALLSNIDPEIGALDAKECERQLRTIELIASENYPHQAVLQALSSSFQNKYSEGSVGKRYYGGNVHVDQLESLCQQRALDLFALDGNVWSVNVQCLSGSIANFTAFAGLAGPGGKIMGLELASGGHLTHGHPVSYTSKFFNSVQYTVDPETCLIDYDKLEVAAMEFKPNVLIAGITAYSRELDYKRFREIADKCGAILMADMAHISGLVAGKALKNNPFEYAHVVTSTTHKTLRGPRSAMIFARKDHTDAIHTKIQSAHFPGLTGGPHNNKICALAVALKLANTEEFRDYAQSMVLNAQHMAKCFAEKGFKVLTGGTDVHMVLVDVAHNSKAKINGLQVQLVADRCNMSLNMNSVPGDKSPLNPSGLRLGVPQLTSRGLRLDELTTVCQFIFEVIDLTEEIKASLNAKPDTKPTKVNFISEMENFQNKLSDLGNRVTNYIVQFPCF